jgi:glycosyltransferase involved in cell wall biosynthesis
MRPRICLVATPSATERGDVLAARLRALLAGGWDAHLLCEGERWTRVPAFDDFAIAPNIERQPERDRYLPPIRMLGPSSRLVRYLRANGKAGAFDRRLLGLRPDLVHFHSASPASKGMRLKEFLGCRVVVSFRDDGSDLDIPNLELLWEGADLALFPDAGMLERAVLRGCPPEKAEVLPVPMPSVRPAMDGRGPEPRPLRVISCGRLTWEHGFEHSVHAVRLLLDVGIDCRYRILGEGDHLVAVAFARHQLNLAQQVEFVSANDGDRLVEELSAADVFVDPAVTDTTSPTPLATALALGVPFVASRREGLPEDAGIAVPRRNPGAIAEALVRLGRDPELRRRLGQAGPSRPDGIPSLEGDSQRLRSLYRRALG